jgi:hypothetical protein
MEHNRPQILIRPERSEMAPAPQHLDSGLFGDHFGRGVHYNIIAYNQIIAAWRTEGAYRTLPSR